MRTSPDTDFWQRTHYGFRRDNGHCLLTRKESDFSISVKTTFSPKKQYDQCGLIVRLDHDNWIKTSTEFESGNHSRLGSVVTNSGYSDWATIDINEPVNEMWYRIQSKNDLSDYIIEFSEDGDNWKQLRITHLLEAKSFVDIGIYACSPMDSSFSAEFSQLSIANSNWK
ncbi:hypothetical protein CAI21_07355 [Alkalilimnicola ehrlichii]|uniref:DUF1349 domain-containing protein n=1 Tax=Alkalilimnicola ehrlichii TaxID=351052 RepID=A0A3E0WYV9_9GAMM|nr:hypothetical protein CAI21_07355 [Alkalilimnicola ehrlichii]RFA37371.1 hypothetical protein CAL65_08690 [Alkalilimnicola ehrlichii]